MDEQQLAAIALEDATPDSELSPEARKRKEARLKKRAARAKEKQQKIAQAEVVKAEQFEDIQQFWEFNRARLTDEQRIGLEVRQAQVWDLMLVMQDYLDRTDGTSEQDLADTIEEVKADIAQYGQCCGAVLCVPRIWAEEHADLRKRIEAHEQLVGRNAPTTTLLTYGFFTAITERLYEDFRQKFMVPRTTQPVEESIMIRCESPNCTNPGRSIPKSFIDRLCELKMAYLCNNCLVAGQRSAAQASINVFKKAERGGIYDPWGRVKL